MSKPMTVLDLLEQLQDVPFDTPVQLRLANDPEEVSSIELLGVTGLSATDLGGPALFLDLHVTMVDDEEDDDV